MKYRHPKTSVGTSNRNAKLFDRNPLLKLLAINGAIGVSISLLILVGLLVGDVGHLRSLISRSQDPVVPLVLLAGGLIITMTSVVMGAAVMMLQDPAKDGRGGGGSGLRLPLLPGFQPALVPVRVKADRRSDHRTDLR